MGRMIFDLTDEDRATLEARRVRLGLRSHAETLRSLIRGDKSEPVQLTSDVDACNRLQRREVPDVMLRSDSPPATGLQIGPTRAAPGSRLDKGKKR